MSADSIVLQQIMVRGQPYWAAVDVAAFLRMSADHWYTGDHADEVTHQIGRWIHQLADQFSVAAMELVDWWARGRPGLPVSTPPRSCLSDRVSVASGVVFGRGGPNLYLRGADVAQFLRAEALSVRHRHGHLFDRESAARMAADYLDDTAEYVELEVMFEARPASSEASNH